MGGILSGSRSRAGLVLALCALQGACQSAAKPAVDASPPGDDRSVAQDLAGAPADAAGDAPRDARVVADSLFPDTRSTDAAARDLLSADASAPSPYDPVWAKRFGLVTFNSGFDVVVDGAGAVYLSGNFSSSIDFGGGAISGTAWRSHFLASLTDQGAYRWAKAFGAGGDLSLSRLALDPQGNLYYAGAFQGTSDFGGGPLSTGSEADVFVASFTGAGRHRWSKHFGDALFDGAFALTVDGLGNVFVTGCFQKSINFGGQTLTSAGAQDIFVASFTSSGAHRWSKSFGTASADCGKGVAVNATGNLVLVGHWLSGSINFGGSALTSAGNSDVFVVGLDSNGAHRFSRGFGDVGADYVNAVAVDSAGNAFVTGAFQGNVDFGGGKISSWSGDAYLASYGPTGSYRWARGIKGQGWDEGTSVVVDAKGDVFVTGQFASGADFGGGPLPVVGSVDGFLASYASNGTYRWAKGHGSAAADAFKGLARDAGSRLFVTGSFDAPITFGPLLLDPAPAASAVVVAALKLL